MGIDPGGTSAYTILGVPERSVYRDAPGRIALQHTGQVTGGYTAQAIELCKVAARYYPLAIALESFQPRKLGIEYSPMLVGARLQFCADMHYILSPIFYQTPAQAMETATDSRLKAWGLYQPGSDHIKDSTRHAITFIRRAKSDPALRARAWGSDEEQRTRTHANGRPANRVNRVNRPAKRVASRARRPLYLNDDEGKTEMQTEKTTIVWIEYDMPVPVDQLKEYNIQVIADALGAKTTAFGLAYRQIKVEVPESKLAEFKASMSKVEGAKLA
jgi:hypothetical protein